MSATRIRERVAVWREAEAKADAWASYAALMLAGVGAALALIAAGHF